MSIAVARSSSPVLSSVRDALLAMRRAEPGFFGLAMLLVFAVGPTMAAMALDPRDFLGVNVWDKPLKFEIALAVYLLTLAFYARYLPAGVTAARGYRIYSGAVIAAIAGEMLWVGGGAAMATASHFNTTPLGIVLYALMGVGAVLLTSASAVYAVLIARNRDARLPPVVHDSLVIGLALVLPLTLLTAGTMSGLGSHWIGGSGSDVAGLPLIGWARDRGDLRVAHFFATHALHFIPLAGLVCAWIWGGTNRLPLRLFSGVFVAFVVAIFVQALSGNPFLSGL